MTQCCALGVTSNLTKPMTKIEREKQIVEVMIRMYCQKKLHTDELPQAYAELLAYAHRRLDCCKFGEQKRSCKKCPIHCYAPQKRELMREVMRWCGPRMILTHPMLALKHLFE